jgi:hypothetical protein
MFKRLLPLVAFILISTAVAAAAGPAGGVRVRISFPASAHAEPITGRVYVAIARDTAPTPPAPGGAGAAVAPGAPSQGQAGNAAAAQPRPRGAGGPIQQAGPTGVPLFGVNVESLKPGAAAEIDGTVFGHPVASLNDIPPGEYLVQAFVNLYTKFVRADGHTVWLHMDQWEGQNWRRSPGNLFSTPRKVRIDPKAGSDIDLVCDQVIPPIPDQPDTDYVKHIKFESAILSKWWGQPVFLGATVLLPKDYDKHPEVKYPVDYSQGHFSTRAPGGFGSGGAFDKLWLAEDMPRFLYVTFQHPSPYYDDSYAVNSENNGPYGDAIMRELIGTVEQTFRVIREPWARLLSGGSTGGWEALALQIFHPDFFGGTFASCPDSVDFRYHQIVNIYDDENAYFRDMGWTRVERPNSRRPDGSIVSMMKDENWFELVAGDRSRSGGQWDIWEATYGPVGPDGYPKRVWDKKTGQIDKAVAAYWKEHFDLRAILERDWPTLGPKLKGKLHVYVGDDDSFYLDDAVELMEKFLSQTKDPSYEGRVTYQRGAPHCWGPRDRELFDLMAKHVEKTAPAGVDLASWRYR